MSPKPRNEFFSPSGEEFHKMVKAVEPPVCPPDPLPPPPPPAKPQLDKAQLDLVFRLVAFLRAWAYVRSHMSHFSSVMRDGLSLKKVREALCAKAGIEDLESLPSGVYANPHVSVKCRLKREVGSALLVYELDELVNALIAPELDGTDRALAVAFFYRLIVPIQTNRLTIEDVAEDPIDLSERTPPEGNEIKPLSRRIDNPWGED